METRFWFVFYNFIILPLLSGTFKIWAPFSPKIKESIEKSFKVSVLKVRTMNVRGDKKRLGRHQGYKSSWKKALVTLKANETIEFFEGA